MADQDVPTLRRTGSSADEKSSVDEKKVDLYGDINLTEVEGDLEAIEEDIQAAQAEAEKLSYDDARIIVQEIVDEYQLDPNFPPHIMENSVRFLEDESLKEDAGAFRKLFAEIKLAASFLRDNSPYPEVRAVVPNTDDPTIPASTIRAWVIGLIFACGGAACNQFFSPRQPAIFLSVYTAQVLAYPLGRLWEKIVPTGIYIPIPFTGGERIALNPGSFTQKEHMLITIMANVSFGSLYTGDIYVIQRLPLFFNQAWASSIGYQITTSLSVQLLGYGIAGITRRFLVYPASCIWPTTMGTIALNRAFHKDKNLPANGWTMSRLKFFGYAFTSMFIYFWFPNFIFPALSYFNWMTWIAPQNVNVAAITGSISGLGVNPFPTFDWNWQNLDPIITPLFSVINIYIGCLIYVPIVVAVWYSNSFNTGYLPINSNHVWDNTGSPYNVSKILTADGLLNFTAYENYSPAYLGAGNMVVYIAFFAIYTCTITYAFLYHRHEIAKGFRSLIRGSANENKDIHNRLMQAYAEVPEWWYGILLLIAIAFGLAGLLGYPTRTSVSSLFFGLVISLVFVVPVGIIVSVTNVEVTLNVLAEFVGGAAYPGNYLAMLFFKTYGVITCAQAISFASDLKLGHYTKIPPRVMFTAQTAATVISTFVSIAIVNWQITSVDGLCTPDQVQKFSCPGINTFFTAAVLWGTISPKNIFAPGKLYNPLLWSFLIGLVLPIPVYYLVKKNPRSWLRYVHVPAILYGLIGNSPYNLSYYTPSLYLAFLFNHYIRRRYLAWWSKYAYILTTAFSVGIAISGIIQFIFTNYNLVMPDWWGSLAPFGGDANFDGCDLNGCPRLQVPDSGFFPPGPGSGF